MKSIRNKQRERDEFNKMKGLNIGNYHPDHSALPGEWQKDIEAKNKRRLSERNHKAQERLDIDNRMREFDSAAPNKNADVDLQKKYKTELDRQVDENNRLRPREPEGAVTLGFGPDREFDKDKYRADLDSQVNQKYSAKRNQQLQKQQDDAEMLRRIKSAQDSFIPADPRSQMSDYKNDLDKQAAGNQLRNEARRRQDELEALKSNGLPLGQYNPNYKEYLNEELRRQIEEKRIAQGQVDAKKRAEDQAYLEKLRIAAEANEPFDQLRVPASYKEELDKQATQNRNLRAENERREKEEFAKMTGLPLGMYNPNYKDELMRGLRDQINDKNARSQLQKEADLLADRERQALLARANDLNNAGQEVANMTDEYRRQLEAQVKSDDVLKQYKKELARLEEMNHTGLNIGDHVPYDKAEFRKGLRSQMDQKKADRDRERQLNRDEDQARAELLRLAQLESMDPALVDRDQVERLRSGLDAQTRLNSELKELQRQRDLEEERNATGLPLGKYNPNYKDALRRGLDSQIQDKKERDARQKQDEIMQEKLLMDQIEAARRANDPALAQQLEKEYQRRYYNDLTDQANLNADARRRQAAQDLEEYRKATGLPLGLYNPDFREELKEALDKQITEKRLLAKRNKADKLQKELADLELQRRALDENYDPINKKYTSDYMRDLKDQMDLDNIRKKEERDYIKAGDNCLLPYSDYRGYDKQALLDGLRRQIEEKRAFAKDSKRADAMRDAEDAERRLRALENLNDPVQFDKQAKEEYKRMLDEQNRLNQGLKSDQNRRDALEALSHTGLPLGLYNPDYTDELRDGLRKQIDEKERAKRSEKERELGEDYERLRLMREAAQINEPVSDEQYYKDLENQVAGNRLRAEQARRRELEELAKSVGLNLGNYKGYDKDEFRQQLNKQIAEKEEMLKSSKVKILLL